MLKLNKEIEIEDLVRILPQSVTFLREKGIRCLQCGEPIWGSLENAAKKKGFDDVEIQQFVIDLNLLLSA
ncbi:MAG: DUF1858 domain-containing protein [Bacteroidetes bacterium]|nr:DUF1858 domain-containing protein [Bacteroidota bacterium]MBU1679731.1 DUF1858 domain-containing protein [Bacteroidota bacterium]